MVRYLTRTLTLAAISVVPFISFSAMAADAAAGKAKAAVCAGCHGADGISVSPDIPNLAGQKEVYLQKAITYYKTGERKNPMMQSMVGGLSEEDIANLAAYYSSLK